MNNFVSYTNRQVKKIEKHLDVQLSIREEKINTVFERFSQFNTEEAVIVLHAADTSTRYQLHYDFNTGNLIDAKNGTKVEINDLFSSRHLRSILFAAHDALFLKASDTLSPLTQIVHKKHPVPVMCTESGDEKKWFLIEHIDIVSESKVEMTGLVSIDKNYVHQPVKATCSFDIRKKAFTWKYSLYGDKKNETNTERYYIHHGVSMSDVLYNYTELKIEKLLSSEVLNPHQSLEREMVSILKNQQIMIVTKKKPDWLAWNYIHALFWGIKSVTDKQIVLLACDRQTLRKEVIFDRFDRKIYADMPGLGFSKRRQEMIFTHNVKGNRTKFEKVIKLIEKRYDTSAQ